jgi:hypothetical protein
MLHANREALLASAKASKLAYNDVRAIGKRNVLGFDVDTIIKKSGIEVYVLRPVGDKKGSTMTVAFKGSTTWKDIRRFLRLSPERFAFKDANVCIHSGVLRMFEDIESELTMAIPRTLAPNKVTFVGHSMGGSLAMLASAYYGDMCAGNLKTKCHIFGAPRMGDAAFHNWRARYVEQHLSVINVNDLIASVPFGFGYEPNPHPIVLPQRRRRVVNPHDISNYITNIQGTRNL